MNKDTENLVMDIMMGVRTLKVLFNKCASDTSIRSEKYNPGKFVVASASCFENYRTAYSNKAVFSQITTVARDREEKDPQTFYLGDIASCLLCVFADLAGTLPLSHLAMIR